MAFAVILSVFTLASTAVFLSLGVTQKAAQQNNVSNLNTQDVIGVLYNVVEQQNATRGFAATRNADLLKDYDANGAAADKNLADFAQRTTRPEQRERAARLKTAIEAWRAKNNEIIALARDPATEFQALAMIDEVRIGDIRVVQGEIMEGQRKLVAQRWEQQQSALGQARITLIGGSIVAILAAAAMAWLLSRAIAAPERKLA